MWAYRQKQKMGFISRRVKGAMVRGQKKRAKKPKRERKGMPKEA